MLTARTGEIGFAAGASARFSHPSSVALQARRAGFHIILRIEMRARGIGRADGMHDGEMLRRS